MSVSNEVTGTVAGRVAQRSTSPARARAEAEARSLIEAALAVLRRHGAAGLTVAEVLAEAGLSTRAFYRHFASKDELLLALFDADTEVVRGRVDAAIASARDPEDALVAWIDQQLALAYAPRRSRRTQVLFAEGRRLQLEFPAEFERIFAAVLAPLVRLLDAGRASGAFPSTDPARDARAIHAVTWDLVEARLAGDTTDLASARAQVLRFCLPALGARA
jgi:AcrR family transcriptional regulator